MGAPAYAIPPPCPLLSLPPAHIMKHVIVAVLALTTAVDARWLRGDAGLWKDFKSTYNKQYLNVTEVCQRVVWLHIVYREDIIVWRMLIVRVDTSHPAPPAMNPDKT